MKTGIRDALDRVEADNKDDEKRVQADIAKINARAAEAARHSRIVNFRDEEWRRINRPLKLDGSISEVDQPD